ncbi:MAG: hypothetical protein Q8J89_06825 [Caulobacter sp.]|nr:hypothetical protein [Caulobacter sp.]
MNATLADLRRLVARAMHGGSAKAAARRRRVLRSWLVPALFALGGTVLGIVFHWSPTAFLAHSLEGVASLFPSTKDVMARHLLDAISAPAGGFLLGLGVAKVQAVQRSVDAIPFLQDPPDFIRRDLDYERQATGMLGWEKPSEFVGRTEELAELVHFAVGRKGFASWREVVGPGGVGKSRLAIEWLETLRHRRWDAGVVDLNRPIPQGWRARRPTALVIDEAQRDWAGKLAETIQTLCAAASERAAIRILVVGKSRPSLEWLSHPNGRALVDASRYSTALYLEALTDEDSLRLWETAAGCDPDDRRISDSAHLRRETAGWPRAILRWAYAKSASSYQEALEGDAIKALPELADARGEAALQVDFGLLKVLALSILAGPLPIDVAQSVSPAGVNFSALDRFFIGADFEETLPSFQPDDLGHEILLRILDLLGHESSPLARIAIKANPDQVGLTLEGLWRTRPESTSACGVLNGLSIGGGARSASRARCLAKLQALYDEMQPRRLSDDRRKAEEFADNSASLEAVAEIDDRLVSICDRRSYDPKIRVEEAAVGIDAIRHYGEARQFDDVERWCNRLTALAAVEPFKSNPTIRDAEVMAMVNAMNSYGLAGRFEDLERWGARLVALLETPPFHRNSAMRRGEARAVANAINLYSQSDRVEECERWGSRLATLATTEPFRLDPAIRGCEASAVVTMVAMYGKARRFEDLERWGARLAALLEVNSLRRDSAIRTSEARAVVNAFKYYGEVGRLLDAERWGARLITLVGSHPHHLDPEIRLLEAMVAVGAIQFYGKGAQFGDLERWGARLIALVETGPFKRSSAIRREEAGAVVNATLVYGDADRFEDLERWGARLIEIAETEPFRSDPSIRVNEAQSAVNAINSYGKAERFDDLERWGAQLIALTEAEPFRSNLTIRQYEAWGILNAISGYGVSGRLEDLERWGARMIALAESRPFSTDPAICLTEAKAAYSAIISYRAATVSKSGPRANWFGRLAKCAQRFPGDGAIQELAHKVNLSLVEQEIRGWPYGRL